MFQPVGSNPVKTCPNCGAKMYLREKNGEKFWGCSMWKENGCRTLPYEQKTLPTKPVPMGTPIKETKSQMGFQLLADDINLLAVEIEKVKNGIKEIKELLQQELGQ